MSIVRVSLPPLVYCLWGLMLKSKQELVGVNRQRTILMAKSVWILGNCLNWKQSKSFGKRPKVFLPSIGSPFITVGPQLFVSNCSLDGYSWNHFTHVFHFRLDGASFCSGCDKKEKEKKKKKKRSVFPKFYLRLVSRSDRAL